MGSGHPQTLPTPASRLGFCSLCRETENHPQPSGDRRPDLKINDACVLQPEHKSIRRAFYLITHTWLRQHQRPRRADGKKRGSPFDGQAASAPWLNAAPDATSCICLSVGRETVVQLGKRAGEGPPQHPRRRIRGAVWKLLMTNGD